MKSERGLMYLLVSVEVLILMIVVIFGVAKKISEPEETAQSVINTQVNRIDDFGSATETETEVAEEVAVTFSEEIEEMLAAMSTEEKVAQLFMVSPEALTGIERVNVAGQGTRTASHLETFSPAQESRCRYRQNLRYQRTVYAHRA